jgi:hypothetical protein
MGAEDGEYSHKQTSLAAGAVTNDNQLTADLSHFEAEQLTD